jgi:hypothetical protein
MFGSSRRSSSVCCTLHVVRFMLSVTCGMLPVVCFMLLGGCGLQAVLEERLRQFARRFHASHQRAPNCEVSVNTRTHACTTNTLTRARTSARETARCARALVACGHKL